MVEFQLPKLSARVRFPSLAPKLLLLSLFGMLWGCAATTTEFPKTDTTAAQPAARGKGVYHKVNKGETLWRVAQVYNVSIDEIIKINRIPNVAKVEENQLVFIPGAETVKVVPTDTEDLNKNEFVWPVTGKVLSYFGERRGLQFSRGIAIQANAGDVVHAARSGEVVFADSLNGYGQTVIIDHRDGYSSVYADNASLTVMLGDQVAKNDPIAHVGKKDETVSLHFEIRKHSVADNPLYYLP